MKSTVETKIIELVKLGHELAKELHCAESAALVSVWHRSLKCNWCVAMRWLQS